MGSKAFTCVVMEWWLRLISRSVANQYNYLHGVTSPASIFESVLVGQCRMPSLNECQPSQKEGRTNKQRSAVLPCPPGILRSGLRGGGCLLLKYLSLSSAIMVVVRQAAVIDHALALCIQVGGDASRTFPQSEAHRPHPQRLVQEP